VIEETDCRECWLCFTGILQTKRVRMHELHHSISACSRAVPVDQNWLVYQPAKHPSGTSLSHQHFRQ
jgi:hypothetical protein